MVRSTIMLRTTGNPTLLHATSVMWIPQDRLSWVMAPERTAQQDVLRTQYVKQNRRAAPAFRPAPCCCGPRTHVAMMGHVATRAALFHIQLLIGPCSPIPGHSSPGAGAGRLGETRQKKER